MTPTLQDFYAECVASLEQEEKHSLSTIFVLKRLALAVLIPETEAIHVMVGYPDSLDLLYGGKDIRRAASILYGITGNENWLRFVSNAGSV